MRSNSFRCIGHHPCCLPSQPSMSCSWKLAGPTWSSLHSTTFSVRKTWRRLHGQPVRHSLAGECGHCEFRLYGHWCAACCLLLTAYCLNPGHPLYNTMPRCDRFSRMYEIYDISVEHTSNQALDLLKNGVPGIHFYVLNDSSRVASVMERVNSFVTQTPS